MRTKIAALCAMLAVLAFSCRQAADSSSDSSGAGSKSGSSGSALELADKSSVMVQLFNWDSAPRSDASLHGKWYAAMTAQSDLIKSNFDLVWLPPPSPSDSSSPEGYLPTEWNSLSNAYGTESELKELISALNPALAIADVVVNHRNGYLSWGRFANPSLCAQGHDDCYAAGCSDFSAIASDDEGFSSSSSEMYGASLKGAADSGESYAACRDLDHTNARVQNAIIDWMNDILIPAGFAGWRYDYVKGFAGEYVGQYNEASGAGFSVGEYWPTDGYSSSNPSAWGNEIKAWIEATAEGGARSRAFDFALKGAMNTVFGCNASGVSNSNYGLLADSSNLIMSQSSDAVTFVDNHDTGSTQSHWYLDPDDIGAAYAFILTHPGVPCVAVQHFLTYDEAGSNGTDSGAQYIGGDTVPGTDTTYQEHIAALIALRKSIGVGYDSDITNLSKTSSVYAARIDGANGSLITSIGSDYAGDVSGYEEVMSGSNFRIWQAVSETAQTTDAPIITIDSDGVVTITCGADEAVIYYTTDGSEPTSESAIYEGAFSVTDGVTVSAIAVKDGLTKSTVVAKTYAAPVSVTLYCESSLEDGYAVYFAGDFDESENWTIAARGTQTEENIWTCDVTASEGTFEWKVLKGSYDLGETAAISDGSLTWSDGENNVYPATYEISYSF